MIKSKSIYSFSNSDEEALDLNRAKVEKAIELGWRPVGDKSIVVMPNSYPLGTTSTHVSQGIERGRGPMRLISVEVRTRYTGEFIMPSERERGHNSQVLTDFSVLEFIGVYAKRMLSMEKMLHPTARCEFSVVGSIEVGDPTAEIIKSMLFPPVGLMAVILKEEPSISPSLSDFVKILQVEETEDEPWEQIEETQGEEGTPPVASW